MKSITLSLIRIAFFVVLSFFWVSLGHAAQSHCRQAEGAEEWLDSHNTLRDWTEYYFAQNQCRGSVQEFWKALATSEPLSTKLNQVRVTFDQFYIPLAHLLRPRWDEMDLEETQEIQSDLMMIDVSLQKVLKQMSAADGDYFRATVLSGQESDFVRNDRRLEERTVANRINLQTVHSKRRMHYRDVAPPPYQPVYMPR